MASDQLDISIRDRKSTLYEGSIKSATSYNDLGVFDVLPQHANFVTLISKKIIINKGLEDEKIIEIADGLMNVSSDRIDVYIGF